jgi:preprotein translocase subunit SecD
VDLDHEGVRLGTGEEFGERDLQDDWEANLVSAEQGYASRSQAQQLSSKEPGTVVISDHTETEGGMRYFVIRDQPDLTRQDIVDPQAMTDPTSQPAVAFQFTSEGGTKFEDLTQRVAQGGGHFAIVVDNELVSLPKVDAQENPQGIDASNGAQISGGLTVQQAEQLAERLGGS